MVPFRRTMIAERNQLHARQRGLLVRGVVAGADDIAEASLSVAFLPGLHPRRRGSEQTRHLRIARFRPPRGRMAALSANRCR